MRRVLYFFLTLPLLLIVHGSSPAAAQQILYAVSQTGDEVIIVDTESLEIAGSIDVGDEPFAVAFSDDGTRAYVTNPRQVPPRNGVGDRYGPESRLRRSTSPNAIAFGNSSARLYVTIRPRRTCRSSMCR
jgi:YVTN family beta-propeller protein